MRLAASNGKVLRRYPLEDDEAIAFMVLLGIHEPEARKRIIHIANERRCSPQRGAKLKAMGVRKGAADYLLPMTGLEGQAGLWIELKSMVGKATPEQIEFLKEVGEQGYMSAVVKGADAALALVRWYLHGHGGVKP